MNSYPEAGYSFTDISIHGNKSDQGGIYQQQESLFPTDYFPKIIHGLLIICPVALLFRKTCLETVSMLDEEMVSGDNDFIIRLALNHKGILIPEQLININRHEDNHSTQYAIQSYYENINTLEKLFRQDKISKSIYREMKSRHYYRAGLHGIREKKYLQARTDFLKSFFSLPTNVKALIRSFQCLFYSF